MILKLLLIGSIGTYNIVAIGGLGVYALACPDSRKSDQQRLFRTPSFKCVLIYSSATARESILQPCRFPCTHFLLPLNVDAMSVELTCL